MFINVNKIITFMFVKFEKNCSTFTDICFKRITVCTNQQLVKQRL